MVSIPQSRSYGRGPAVLVLLVAMAVTLFAGWREHELVRRGQIIRWQEGFSQLNPLLSSLLGQRFDPLKDHVRATIVREGTTETAWQDFLQASEWQERYPGMIEIGYAEPVGHKCIVKFVASAPGNLLHGAGFDLNSDEAIHETIERSATLGYGIASREISPNANYPNGQPPVCFLPLPLQEQRPGTAAENRANLRGFIFFILNRPEYFRACQPQLKSLPLNLTLFPAGRPFPPRTLMQRGFSVTTISGEWRFLAIMQPPSPGASASQWIVLGGGTALSLLMFFLFSTQARLRREAELASEKVLLRDTEIMSLNRGLEATITSRTAELNTALAEEKELNRLKSNFISMVTHEIRTPLALILGSSEILSRYLDRLTPEKRAGHLQTIDAAVQRMSALLEDVLLFSKAEAGRMDFNPVPVELKSFCTQLVDELASATNRRCPLVLSVSEITEAARADEGLLRHILSNLIANAVKYSAAGTPVNLSVVREGGDAIFIVADQGMGIPEADRKRLFTPFFRGTNVTTTRGTGLGLVIVKHCVERHGGRIEITSAKSVGTTVNVRLPLFSPAHTEFIKRFTEPLSQ